MIDKLHIFDKPSNETSVLTYDFYCFKRLKITLLWQNLIETKFNAGICFSSQRNTSLRLD